MHQERETNDTKTSDKKLLSKFSAVLNRDRHKRNEHRASTNVDGTWMKDP